MNRVFISYAHEDEAWKDRILTHLKALQLGDALDVWDDRKIGIGEPWRQKIREAISDASIAILLISKDFLASDFITGQEIQWLLEERRSRDLRLLPVIVEPCVWKTHQWLASLQVTPTDVESLSMLPDPIAERELATFAENVWRIRMDEDAPPADPQPVAHRPPAGIAEPPHGPSPQALESEVTPRVPAGEGSVASAPADLSPSPTNLPILATSFIAREQEVTQLQRLLTTSSLITLTGPGGCGKTRLAIECSRRMLESFPDGVWFVSLVDQDEAFHVPGVIASVIGFPVRPDAPVSEQVSEYLATNQALIVLDNMEQIRDAGAYIQELCRSLTKTRLIATSRVKLGVPGEQVFPVGPLPAPEEGSGLGRGEGDAGEQGIEEYPSVRLFLDRAMHADPGFRITASNAEAVGGICRKLDGIPLALELAAARCQLLSPSQLLERLDRHGRFRILRIPRAAASGRHDALRHTIDWSYNLLTPREQSALMRLAVLPADFSLEAAEAIAADDEGAFELVSSLLENSLIQKIDRGDRYRYRMLEMIRGYVLEKLPDQSPYLAASEFFVRWLTDLPSASRADIYGALDREYRNIIALADACYSVGVDAPALRSKCWPPVATFARSMLDFMWARGYLDERVALSTKAVEVHTHFGEMVDAGAHMYANGWVYVLRGQLDEARRWAKGCEAAMQAGPDDSGMYLAHHLSGLIAMNEGDFEAARDRFQSALACNPVGIGPGSAASVKTELGHIARKQREFHEAKSWYEQALEDNLDHQNIEGQAISKGYIAEVYECTQQPELAEKTYREALALASDVGRSTTMARCRVGLARTLRDRGELSAAREQLSEARELYRALNLREEINRVSRLFDEISDQLDR